MLVDEEIGSNGHSDGEVGAELVVFVFLAGFIEVFVDPTTIDDCRVDVVLFVFRWRERNEVAAFKVLLDFRSPVGEGNDFYGGV